MAILKKSHVYFFIIFKVWVKSWDFYTKWESLLVLPRRLCCTIMATGYPGVFKVRSHFSPIGRWMTLPPGISAKITCTDIIFLYVSRNYCLVLIKQSIHLAVLCLGNWYMFPFFDQPDIQDLEAKDGKSHTVTSYRVSLAYVDYILCH